MRERSIFFAPGLLLIGVVIGCIIIHSLYLARDRRRAGAASAEAERQRVVEEKAAAAKSAADKRIDGRTQRIIAVHEAGHAVVAMVLFGPDEVESISVHGRVDEAWDNRYGVVIRRRCNALREDEDWRAEIVLRLAGRAAEQVVRLRRTDGASEDLREARDAAAEIHYLSGLGRQLFVHEKDRALAVDQALIESELARGLERALVIVRENEKCVRQLADKLMNIEPVDDRRYMSGAEFRRFVAQYPPVRPKTERRPAGQLCEPKKK